MLAVRGAEGKKGPDEESATPEGGRGAAAQRKEIPTGSTYLDGRVLVQGVLWGHGGAGMAR